MPGCPPDHSPHAPSQRAAVPRWVLTLQGTLGLHRRGNDPVGHLGSGIPWATGTWGWLPSRLQQQKYHSRSYSPMNCIEFGAFLNDPWLDLALTLVGNVALYLWVFSTFFNDWIRKVSMWEFSHWAEKHSVTHTKENHVAIESLTVTVGWDYCHLVVKIIFDLFPRLQR